MHPVQTETWDPQSPFKHASCLPPQPPSGTRLAHVTSAAPAKRITFYKSGDNQFGGVRMAIHKRSFKCFDALLDDLSQKVPLPFGVRTVTTPRGTHAIKHLEQFQDGGCYLCSDRRQAKPVNMELASKRPSIWYYHGRRPRRPENSPTPPPGNSSHRQRRILLVKNSEPGVRRSMSLSRRSTRSLRAFLDEASEVMQFHVRKVFTAEGRRIDNVQSLVTCPGVLVCVGREAFSPMLVNFIRKSSEEKLPGLGNRSPGLGPRTPGNGARSPATQGARSPPRGAQSRASEYSEGVESKKNANFGLETKKSIIHPRSDSSNRSTRFSLSSDKSCGNGAGAYSQARPAITNDDIEKRVLVNKDGSLSVEMRVRFRLHNDETLQWSTQVKKSPTLTSECCSQSQSQSQSHYLQQAQSESCSDPDSTSCPCCYQRPEHKYDLWENPAHSHKNPPVPPPHASNRTARRHTHSSSSSSSCNSRRLVRCRARVSNCEEGSRQSQLVQEEMFVTEQVERRVEQGADTHVEVCRVSRCCSRSEVVAIDSRKSAEEEEVQRPLSAISSSSHVLQEDDDFPLSPSQCCHCNESSPSPTIVSVEVGQALSSVSRASSGKAKTPNSEGEEAADGEEEEPKRSGSGSSGHTGLSVQSRTSSVCPDCGGCRRGVNSYSESRASQRSPKPTTSLLDQENATNGSDDDADEGSDEKGGESREERASAATSHRSDGSRKSDCKGNACSAAESEEVRSSSAVSAKSSKSHKSNCSGTRQDINEDTKKRAPSSLSAKSGDSAKIAVPVKREGASPSALSVEGGKKERPESVLSVRSVKSTKSNASEKSSISHGSICSHRARAVSPGTKEAAEPEVTGHKEGSDAEERATSAMSAKSHKSTKAGEDGDDRATSQVSHRSAKSNKSSKSNCHGNESATPPSSEEKDNEVVEERISSAMSGKSHNSAKSSKSHKSNRTTASAGPSEPDIPSVDANEEEEENKNQERVASVMSSKSKSCRKSSPNVVTIKTPDGVDEEVKGTTVRARSSASAKSRKSNVSSVVSHKSNNTRRSQLLPVETRGPSALSLHSTTSAKSGKSKCRCGATSAKDEEASERSVSVLSSSTKRQRRESEGTEQSGSVSLCLPEDQDTADSDSSKSSVSFHTKSEIESRVKTTSPQVSKNTSTNTPSQSAFGIPTIETPRESDAKVEESGTETGTSGISAKSSRSCGSCCKCGVEASEGLARLTSGSPTEAGNDLETQSVKSSSTSKARENRAPSASAKDRSNSSTRARDKDVIASRPASEAKGKEGISDNKSASVRSKSPCCLRPESAENSTKELKRKSRSSGSTKTNGSQEKVKVETRSASKASKTSVKSRSGRSRNQTDPEELDLSPACLPNASANEVVSDWLRSIPTNSSMLALGDEPNEEEEEEEVGPEKVEEAEEKEETDECDQTVAVQSSDPAPDDGGGASSHPNNKVVLSGEPLPRNLQSSAAVMKVLLSPPLGRCQSMPEVSSVYGRRLSTSAQGLLDCLAQLQLIEPAGGRGLDQIKDRHYENIMAILQSLWLAEPRIVDAKGTKGVNVEQVSPPRSSSGVGMSSGSGGSGKENDNQSGDKTTQNKKSLQGEEGLGKTLEDEEEGNKENEAKNEDVDDSTVPTSPDSPKTTENPSSTDKSSAKDSSKSTSDHDPETPEDSSSSTPPTILQGPLSKRTSQEPDPVWVLHLLKKLEKQFMSHYVNTMAEFKVRWDLDDSLILDTMIGELRDEVSRRIQSSVDCEMRKIQSRAGKGGRGILSKESTVTDKRRKILKVMKKQSVKTGDSLSDAEMTGEFSDQRSDDEYCPCDACVRKKMAARPLKANSPAAEAPVMMEFDLLKILQRKKSPSPAAVTEPTNRGGDSEVADDEVRSLEVVREEEEEETKENIKADVVLEETIPEEDEETGEDEDGTEEEGGAEGDEEEGEEEEEAVCQCQSARSEEEEEDDAEDDEESAGDEEASDKETVKETTGGEEEEEEEGTSEDVADSDDTKNEESPLVEEGNAGTSADDEGDTEEEESQGEKGGECEERGEEASDEDKVSAQGQGVTEGEEADAEDSDTDRKRPSGTSVDESKQEEANANEGAVLPHQFTRTSVESQPGSLDDIQEVDSPRKTGSTIKASNAAERRSHSPGKVKCRKPKDSDVEADDSSW